MIIFFIIMAILFATVGGMLISKMQYEGLNSLLFWICILQYLECISMILNAIKLMQS